MEAKLSKLQRWILLAAYEQIEFLEPITWQKWREVYVHYSLSRHEVLMDYFHLPDRAESERHPSNRIIDRGLCGHATFNRANASLSRALKRLRRRGLLMQGWGCTHLEYDGIEVARELKRGTYRGSSIRSLLRIWSEKRVT